jgi:aspartokinase/homoserine dehydrogenase 1
MKAVDVYKFGGVAVGSAEALRVAAAHVRVAAAASAAGARSGRRYTLVVVVSAMNGVTDLLLGAARAALARNRDAFESAAVEFEARHVALAREVLKRPQHAIDDIQASAAELRAMCESIAVLHELTRRAEDAIVARGERTLARIFADFINAEYIDPTELVFLSRRLGSLWPDFVKCERAAKRITAPVTVVPGFIGLGPDGEVVTLGRGGTDFSAAILARSIGARSVVLWKEVDGLMTADPKSVPNARLIEELHYREAAELAFFGAKVLHPRTMIPLVERGIPLFVRNTFREESSGTRIAGDVKPGHYPVRALTVIRRQALVAIEGKGMIGVPGVAGRAFGALAAAGHSVSMISQASSESSICFVVPEDEADHAIRALAEEFRSERRLKLIDKLSAEKKIALIAVVGLGMRGRPGIAARTFSALSGHGVNVIAIAQGSSELNITIAVDESQAKDALVALHNEFQLDKVRPLADTSGRESKLTLLGFGQIGRALSRQLIAQEKHLRAELGVDIKVIAVADRSGIKVQEKGFGRTALQRLAKEKASGGRIFDRAPRTLADLEKTMRDEVWLLPSHRPILVDLTSEETASLLQEALERGFHIVLANKKPLAVPQLEYNRLFATARERHLSIRYEATAGAGLPVLDTLAKLREAGDRVETIIGCFSGTLGYLMTAIEDGQRFSDAVAEAKRLGYTEPDPRDDLSGRDVARKALILARALGRSVEFDEIALDDALLAPDADEMLARRVAVGEILRYTARIDRKGIRVGLESVPPSSPMARLRGTDNQVVIYSKRYKTNPLVVTGPGAGADVTAAGVLNDIVAITVQERRR